MDQVEAIIPYLRRYARAVTGTRPAGDKLVANTLKTLSESALQTPGRGLRLHLYGALDAYIVANLNDPGISAVRALATAERRALLLTEVEGFSVADVAVIMRKAEADILALLSAARQSEITAAPTGVFIIEDEALIAAHIGGIVQAMGHNVLGTASSAKTALAACRNLQPNLILSDVILNGEASGADVATEIASLYAIPVVFITAFPHALLRGETGEPAFLVEKPFTAKTIRAVIGQALLQTSAHETG